MQVVNVKAFGGIKAAKNKGVIYCGRPSVLGNPFSHLSSSSAKKVETREEAIDSYRRWLYLQLVSGNKEVIQALESLKESDTLGCWCKPLACHCDIIISAWNWWKTQGRKKYGLE